MPDKDVLIKGKLGIFLNWLLRILQGFKNAALFKRGSTPEDLTPRMRDPRE